MTKKFLDIIMPKINTIMTTYYEKVPNNATYPYGVVPTISITPLNYGYQCLFDIEIYVNEISESNVEVLCDNLRVGLDTYCYRDTDIGFYIYFESQYLTKQNEQDFTMRRVSFIARIF